MDENQLKNVITYLRDELGEKENELYLKKLSQKNDDDENEEEDEEIDELIIKDLSAKKPITSSSDSDKKMKELDLLDESISKANSSSSSSSDDSFTTPKASSQNQPIPHHCTYFGEDKIGETPKCQHKMTIRQNVCLKCEYGRDFTDSLDHMAFLSPPQNKSDKNFKTLE